MVLNSERSWALLRRLEYIAGISFVFLVAVFFVYWHYFYKPPTCFDKVKNGDERGVDCGGSCTRICSFDVTQPTVKWAHSFMVTPGQYNAEAYIENRNKTAAAPSVPYTLTLYDKSGIIATRTGTTILPPDSVYPVFESRIETGDRVPTRTALTLGDITMWLPASAGSNQFTVQDRTLSGADLSPRLVATLYNNALTDAKNVEVVATIFDAHGTPLTASHTFVDDFPGRSTQQVVFTWPEPIAKTVRSCEVPTDAVLAIDVSGSMNNDGGNPPQPISSVLSAAESFTGRLRSNDQVGLVTFASNAITESGLTTNVSGVSDMIRHITIDPKEERGTTNTSAGLDAAGAVFASSTHNSAARKVLIILTDGLATSPDPDPTAAALAADAKLKQEGVTIYAIGLGTSVDHNFVTQLATDPKHAFFAFSSGQVDSVYKQITGSICEDGAAVIDIIPKTSSSFSSLQPGTSQ